MTYTNSKLTKVTYSLDDIGVVQAPVSRVEHRKDVNPFIKVCGREVYPIFASPMESVIDENNYKIFLENKITPVIPRSVMGRLGIHDRLVLANETFVAFSLSETRDIFINDAYGNLKPYMDNKILYICIDLAQGTMQSLLTTCREIKDKYSDKVCLMTGNINNPLAYKEYAKAGISYMRLSVGSGSRCTTACAVSIFTGLATLIDDIMQVKKEYYLESNASYDELPKVIVDGGIDWYDKIQKSIVLGADGVMIGKLFAECEEACGPIYYSRDGVLELFDKEEYAEYKEMGGEEELTPYRMYRGMSHRSSQKLIGGDGSKVSEGICKPVVVKYPLGHWVNNMDSYLRSCMSYTDSFNIDDLKAAEVVILANNGKQAYAK